jgi:hypothetical protein
VSIVGSYWSFYGANTFGVTLIPMFLAVALPFWNGKSPSGWVLTVGSSLFILAGVIEYAHLLSTDDSFQHHSDVDPPRWRALIGRTLPGCARYKRSVIERFRDKYGTDDMKKYYSDGVRERPSASWSWVMAGRRKTPPGPRRFRLDLREVWRSFQLEE